MAHGRIIALGAALVAACTVAPALASAADDTRRAKRAPNARLWATVNVCDTVAHPNAVGIRASMPGTGTRGQRMYMRFQLQYYLRAERRWVDTGPSGDSGFVDVGSARFRARQAGRTFTLSAPARGKAFRLRGLVTFEWREDGEVLRSLRRRTTGGHPTTRGADPVGYTAASCVVRD